jgi:CheY-like chemotaxis protein
MKTKKPYIILVDDDDDDRQLFREALDELQLDAKVVTFSNGVDLMANLLDSSLELPDMIFLDLNMPLMSGEECLVDIRNGPIFSRIPIIIYSGYFDGFKVKLLQKKGADRYLQKPKSFPQLKQSIKSCLESLKHRDDPNTEFVIK